MIKEHYADGVVQKMAMQKNIAYGLLMKQDRATVAGGAHWNQPVGIALPSGGSSTFSVAITNANNNTSKWGNWQIPRATHYRLAQIKNETIEATETGDIDAFEPALKEFDRAMKAEVNYINFRFFRGSSGSIAKMTNTAFATTALTLDDASGTWGVTKGDVLQLSADGINAKAGTLTIGSVARTGALAGTITTTANISTGVATAANLDFVCLNGDVGLAASGLADWIPDSPPTSTPFFGQDRTADIDYLGGVRVDGSDGRSVANVIIDMVANLDTIGGDPDIVFMHPITFGTLSKQLEGKWVINSAAGYDGKKVAGLGFSGFQVNLNGHALTIYTDRCCPIKRIYMLQWDAVAMFSAGKAPMFLQERVGQYFKVSESFDGYESRIGEYLNFCVATPGWCAVGLLA
jgi:hypothetical protein